VNRWKAGDQILQQGLWFETLIGLRPQTVVQDTPEWLVLYTHAGTVWTSNGLGGQKKRGSLPVEERVKAWMVEDRGPLIPRKMGNRHVLTITPPKDRYSVWLFWDGDWNLQRWYVNIQEPLERNSNGILERDQVLDLSLEPDKSWSWKDVDELEEMVRQGHFSKDKGDDIRAVGERMIGIIDRNESPFCDGWESWRPDPKWPTPNLPSDNEIESITNRFKLTL